MHLYLTLLISLLFVCRLPGFAQEIAITFDDAPTHSSPVMSGEERTSKILEQLKAHHVGQVAFFVTTIHLDQDPKGLDRLQQYAAAGHLLANHSHSHQWIRSIGTNAYIKDIQFADSIMKSLPNATPWFRYPFLDEGRTRSSRDSIRAALNTLKLSNGYVTIDNYDWYLNQLFREAVKANKTVDLQKLKALYLEHVWNSIQFYDAVAKRILGRSPKHVLLLHENDLAAYFIGDLIQLLKDKKWKIISPAEAYRDPIAASEPDVLFNGQGRVAAIAFDKGVPARELVQESEDEAYLDKLVATQQVFK